MTCLVHRTQGSAPSSVLCSWTGDIDEEYLQKLENGRGAGRNRAGQKTGLLSNIAEMNAEAAAALAA